MPGTQSIHRDVQTRNPGPLSGKQEKHIQEADLNDVVKEVQALLAPLLQGNRDTVVEVTLSEKSLRIAADSASMLDAILSLVSSALHALPDGGTCSLCVREVSFRNGSLDGDGGSYGPCACLVVSHAGRGSDAQKRTHLVRSPSTTGPGAGKDGDLSRAYRVIRQHHGSIRRECVPGHRTTITVYLPLAGQDGHAQQETGYQGSP